MIIISDAKNKKHSDLVQLFTCLLSILSRQLWLWINHIDVILTQQLKQNFRSHIDFCQKILSIQQKLNIVLLSMILLHVSTNYFNFEK